MSDVAVCAAYELTHKVSRFLRVSSHANNGLQQIQPFQPNARLMLGVCSHNHSYSESVLRHGLAVGQIDSFHDDVLSTLSEVVDAACQPHAAEEVECFEACDGQSFVQMLGNAVVLRCRILFIYKFFVGVNHGLVNW